MSDEKWKLLHFLASIYGLQTLLLYICVNKDRLCL